LKREFVTKKITVEGKGWANLPLDEFLKVGNQGIERNFTKSMENF
jgi:hypothetical protein